MTELALNYSQGMLDLCTHLGDDPDDLFTDAVELVALWGFAHGTPDLAILTEAGRSDSQIQAVTGHRTLEMVQKYRAGANQKRLSREAQSMRNKNGT